MNEKRTKILNLNAEVLVGLLKDLQAGTEIRVHGLPTDARILNASFDHERLVFRVLLESDSFPPTPPGAMAPDLEELVLTRGTYTFRGYPTRV